ncbi:uncharacterized protein LOC141833993 [Curcuma longa]|uniref:uncharacterized protein LOC141833993 n=1 Tax=Curcuma longa TaxID=136217 RepID=UPI003D9E5E2C
MQSLRWPASTTRQTTPLLCYLLCDIVVVVVLFNRSKGFGRRYLGFFVTASLLPDRFSSSRNSPLRRVSPARSAGPGSQSSRARPPLFSSSARPPASVLLQRSPARRRLYSSARLLVPGRPPALACSRRLSSSARPAPSFVPALQQAKFFCWRQLEMFFCWRQLEMCNEISTLKASYS